MQASKEDREQHFVAYANGLNKQFIEFLQSQYYAGNGSTLQVRIWSACA